MTRIHIDDDDLRSLSSAEAILLDQLVEERMESAAGLILRADYLLLATGAGMSVGCGLPTYRSYDLGSEAALPTGVEGADGTSVPYETIASPAALTSAPRTFYDFMGKFYNASRDAQPGAAYRTLRAWQDLLFLPDHAFTFTSNVDGMHLRAGFEGVFECHGSKMRWQCAEPCERRTWDLPSAAPAFRFPVGAAAGAEAASRAPVADEGAEASAASTAAAAAAAAAGTAAAAAAAGAKRPRLCEATRFVRQCAAGGPLRPACPRCGGAARPAVLLFGDDAAALYEAPEQLAAWRAWRRGATAALAAERARRLVVVEIGAGPAVPTVRRAGEELLREVGPRQCTLLRINPAPVAGDHATEGVLFIKAAADDAVRGIAARMRALAREAAEMLVA